MTTAQIKNSFKSIGEIEASAFPSTLTLKFSFTKNSIRYFVLSNIHHQIIFFGEYTLHHITTVNELSLILKKVFEKDEVLQLPFSEALVGSDEKYSILPEKFYLAIRNTEQLSQRCSNVDIVYEYSETISHTISRFLDNVQFVHLNSTYFNLLPEYLDESVPKLFVNVSKEHLDIISFNKNKQLQFMNRYKYHTVSDFIYFILFCCNKSVNRTPFEKIDRERTELVLIGEVDIQSKLYDICYRYFRSLTFIQKPEDLHFSKAFAMYPNHIHFNLYNLKA